MVESGLPNDVSSGLSNDVLGAKEVGRTQGAFVLGTLGPLSVATLERAREISTGWDIYALEAEWRAVWQRSGRPVLRAPDKAFLGWLNKRLGLG
jgi:hypothetical protein